MSWRVIRFIGLDLKRRFGWIGTLLYRSGCFLLFSTTTNISDLLLKADTTYCIDHTIDEDGDNGLRRNRLKWMFPSLLTTLVRAFLGLLIIFDLSPVHFPNKQTGLVISSCLLLSVIGWVAESVLVMIGQILAYEKEKIAETWAATADPIAVEPAKILTRGSDAPHTEPNQLMRAGIGPAGSSNQDRN